MLGNRMVIAMVVMMSILLGGAVAESPAWSNVITYDFTVSAFSGPLAGVVAMGSFSFDETLVPASENGIVSAQGLLSEFSFTWNGIAFDALTANTGSLAFSPSGTPLSGFVFGNSCDGGGQFPPNTCVVRNFTNDWRISSQFGITYALPDVAGQFGGGPENSTTFERRPEAVPEPVTVALLGSGFALLASVGWRRHRRTDRQHRQGDVHATGVAMRPSGS